MKSNALRAVLGVVALAAAVTLFVVLQDDGGSDEPQTPTTSGQPATVKKKKKSSPPKPRLPQIVIRNGKPVGGVKELGFERGERVRFKVTSDVSDELHLHGYDISKEVAAGGSASFDFRADIEGIFELELEHRAEPIAELEVGP